jgi:hypothetical protein
VTPEHVMVIEEKEKKKLRAAKSLKLGDKLITSTYSVEITKLEIFQAPVKYTLTTKDGTILS